MCPNYHSKFEEYHLLCDMPTPRDAVASKKSNSSIIKTGKLNMIRVESVD